jgi:peptide/nickel transport system ATP-binding protein
MSRLLEVRDLSVASIHFPERPIVERLHLDIDRGEVVALVGESGSGKSVFALSLFGLLHPTLQVVNGSIRYGGQDLLALDEPALRALRGDRFTMILQDPTAALNPVLRIGTQILEAIRAHRAVDQNTARQLACEALSDVGIPSPRERLAAYPHQLSGGMRQRVAIAIALINGPELIVADEPTTALDVTIQSQILSVVSTLVRRKRTALLWITHDLAVVANLADRVCVMYAGQIVESGQVEDVLHRPRHPYTAGLIASIPDATRRGSRLQQIPGMQPDARSRPTRGCRFAERCSRSIPSCRASDPPIEGKDQQWCRCFNPHAA